MTKFLTLIWVLTMTLDLTAQSIEVKMPNGSEKLLGQWRTERLTEAPYGDWFNKNYREYNLDTNVLGQIPDDLAFDSVTIFMGTWCGDSKREVPRFIKLLDSIDFDNSKVKLVCVDRTFQNYKQSPGREESGQGIHRVPTLLFHKSGEELSRIVESPVVSLESDLMTISRGDNYEPNYRAVLMLAKMISSKGVSYVKQHKKEVADELRPVVSSKYELNTYGLVLFSSFQLAEAEMTYELNKLLFPEEPLPYFSLGKFEAMLGDTDLAMADLEKATALAPDDKRIKAYLDKVKNLD